LREIVDGHLSHLVYKNRRRYHGAVEGRPAGEQFEKLHREVY
jgi:hypothetical protein